MKKVVYNQYTFNVVGEVLCGPHGKFLWLQQGTKDLSQSQNIGFRRLFQKVL